MKLNLKSNIKKLVTLSLVTSALLPYATTLSSADSFKHVIGRDRVDTSIKASDYVTSNTLVVAHGKSYADALSSINIVNKHKAKFVLVDDNTDLYSQFKNKGITKIYVVGGLLKSSTIDNLKKITKDVEIIEGVDRYETNKKTLIDYNAVGVADGRNFPDALSGAGLLSYKNIGLMLVDGSKPYTTDKNVRYTFGGHNSVSQNGGKRLYGQDRYLTSKAINKEFDGKLSAYVDGSTFADALSAMNIVAKNTTNVHIVNRFVDAKDVDDNTYLIGGRVSVKYQGGTTTTTGGTTGTGNIGNNGGNTGNTGGTGNTNTGNTNNNNTGSTGSNGSTNTGNNNSGNTNTGSTTNPKPTDTWIKKEKTERQLVKEGYTEYIYKDVPKMEWHMFTSDGKTNLSLIMVERGLEQYAPNGEEGRYRSNFELSSKLIEKSTQINNLIDSQITNNKSAEYQKLIDYMNKNYKNVENALDGKENINSEAPTIIKEMVNILKGYGKISSESITEAFIRYLISKKSDIDNNIQSNMSKPEYQAQFLANEIHDNEWVKIKNEFGDGTSTEKQIQVGTTKVKAGSKWIEPEYKTYKITWEENYKGEKRNEVKTEVR